MRIVLKLVLGLLAFVVIVVVAAGAWVSRLSHQKLAEAQEVIAGDWNQFEARVLEDDAALKDEPLLATHAGDDAAGLLSSRVRWESDTRAPLETGATLVPEAVSKQLDAWGPDWMKHASDDEAAVVDAVDFAWMAELSKHGFWDLESGVSPLVKDPFNPLNESVPRFADLFHWAKARLLKGLREGKPGQAAQEVRELARLCFSTENLVGAMVGVALLGIESRAHEAAVAKGLDVTGWEPVPEERRLIIKRIHWAAIVPLSVLATGRAATTTLAAGRCVAIHEAMGLAHYARGYAERLVPERYAALTRAINESSCRLTRGRAAWASNDPGGQLPVEGKALCEAINEPRERCEGAANFLQRLSVARGYIGAGLLAASNPDWFKPYRPE